MGIAETRGSQGLGAEKEGSTVMRIVYRVRIPVIPITDSGMNPITESGQPEHWSERSDAGVGL